MRPTIITAEEHDLRLKLSELVGELSLAMNRCPALDALDGDAVTAATGILADANKALKAARDVTASLEQLARASHEAILLATSSRIVLGVVEEALALLVAELDRYTQ